MYLSPPSSLEDDDRFSQSCFTSHIVPLDPLVAVKNIYITQRSAVWMTISPDWVVAYVIDDLWIAILVLRSRALDLDTFFLVYFIHIPYVFSTYRVFHDLLCLFACCVIPWISGNCPIRIYQCPNVSLGQVPVVSPWEVPGVRRRLVTIMVLCHHDTTSTAGVRIRHRLYHTMLFKDEATC